MSIWERFDGYGFIHHRALNDFRALQDATQLMHNFPTRTHIFEGDICWDFTRGDQQLFFRHPRYVIDTLPAAKAKSLCRHKQLVDLGALAALKSTNALLVIELKLGRGDWRRAITKLIDILETHFPDRYWIDGFSLPMLDYVKQINPGTSVTLHTEFVYREHILIAAPEWPIVKIRKLADLSAIDGIAIRRRGSGAVMARACADVQRAGKALILSRLFNLRDFERSKRWGAKAGYVHSNFAQLLELNDKIDLKQGRQAARGQAASAGEHG